MEMMRLDKFFSSQNIASRTEIKTAVKKGLVKVNGVVAKKNDMKIDAHNDEISLNGEKIEYKKYIYIMLNKPQGVVSATNDRSQTTVIDLVPPELFRPNLFPAGRLDKDTVGFVLITDDGDFAHRILSPKNHVEKTYIATINGKLKQEDIKTFEEGLVLGDGFECLPAKIRVVEDNDHQTVEIKLCEGKYHQIKRMIASIGLKVLTLKRTKMGSVWLDENLQEGQCKEMLHKDVEKFLL